MLTRTVLIASLLGGLLPLSSHAQTAPAAARFYVGVAGNQLSNVPFNDSGIVPRLIGPSLTAGWQLTPRLAVQAGLSYHWKKDSFASYQFISNQGGTGAVTTSTQRLNHLLVPVLLRYTVTAPAERFHFDVLAGATLVHATSRFTSESTGTAMIDPVLRESSSSDTRFNLTLGPAVRAALSSRLELTASGLVSAVVGESYYSFSDRLFLNTSLGINYTFGHR